MTVGAFILSMWHDRLMRRVLVAFVALSTAAVLFVGTVGAIQQPPERRLDRDDWPACTLFTELARDKLRDRGHSVKYVALGSRGGFYWLDGTRIGKASGEDAPFMACATEKVIAPIRDVPRY